MPAAEKPNGILGVDAISVNYTYFNSDLSHYGEADYNAEGFEIGINKNILDRAQFGVDANLGYAYATNLSLTDEADLHQHTVGAGATVFMKGAIRPFFSFATEFFHTDVNYKDGEPDYSEQSWMLVGRGGVEMTIADGLSGRLYLAERHFCDGDSPKNIISYNAEVVYWLTDKAGLSLGESYSLSDHVRQLSTSVAVYYRF